MDQATPIRTLVHDPSDPVSVREAIAAIKAEYGVRETRAYAMLVRAAAGLPMTPVPQQRAPHQTELLAG